MSETASNDKEKRRPDWPALFVGIFLAIVGGVVAEDALRLTGGAYSQIGPAAFPYAIAAGFVILAIWTIVSAIRGDFPERSHDEVAPILWIVAGLVAQILLLDAGGFSIATGLLFAFAARGLGRGQLWKTIPIGIVFSFLLYVVFTAVLNLSLPEGPLERLLPF